MQDSEAAAGATASNIETTVTATRMGRSRRCPGAIWLGSLDNEIEANCSGTSGRCEKIQKNIFCDNDSRRNRGTVVAPSHSPSFRLPRTDEQSCRFFSQSFFAHLARSFRKTLIES
jgi:hypothetical protein